jgi:hypothetical protein
MPIQSRPSAKRADRNPATPTKRRTIQSKAAVRRTRALSKPNAERSPSFTQAAVTSNFLAICRDAIRDKSRVYVTDRAGQRYLTLDPKERYLGDPIIDVSAQFFKDNFSRFSSLIKDGLSFRLSHRGSKPVIYARRHTQYRDPLDHVIEQWREQVAEAASIKKQEETLLAAIKAIGGDIELRNEDLLQTIRQLKQGITRLAIGHRPFEEGLLPENNYRDSTS